MKLSSAFKVTGLVAGIAVIAFLSQGEFAAAGRDATAEVRAGYTGCLAANYQTGQSAGPKLLMDAYRKCKTQEQAYKSGLVKTGVAGDDVMKVIQSVNEATMARHMGVAPSETKGWGCIRPHKPEQFVVS